MGHTTYVFCGLAWASQLTFFLMIVCGLSVFVYHFVEITLVKLIDLRQTLSWLDHTFLHPGVHLLWKQNRRDYEPLVSREIQIHS